MAFVTVVTVVAAVVHVYTPSKPLRTSLKEWLQGEEPTTADELDDPPRSTTRLWWHTLAGSLIDPLCDIQTITGVGIVVAGLSQYQSTTAYDRALVYNYWNITLLSIWTSISDGFETVAEKSFRTASAHDRWGFVRTQVRRSAILVSLVLGLVNNVSLTLDEQWNSETSGLCFRYNDFSSRNIQWFWIAGLCLLTARTAVEIAFPKVTLALDRVDEWASRSERWLIRRTRQAWGDVSAVPMSISGVQKRGGFVQSCFSALLTLSWAICVIFWWLLRQFLATWAVGVGTPAVTAIANSAFLVWNMEDVISTKVLNIPLAIDSGPPWGFGQVLPMVLLLAVLLNGLDAAREADVEAEEHEKKARSASSAGGESEENLILGALDFNAAADASGLQHPVPAHPASHFQPEGLQYRRSFPVRIA
ncbi:hypothetical protein LTR02_000542 [Friedmanniomyces endolithicus]|nr:hypothetical protein LTR94_008262 [Friedmanniomyces endolithicus]KAK0792362.1 hypothetical protein LTR59_008564 [Friedmanniomyces endolithicus]KAK0815710.1 hypothetical protein LTR38_002356 [Friedmanniomyces endolithicus]KAK0821321.1 hypothetical protein LTR75_000794 [Friedmanniomyces endolithicus]KAK0841245.1 hypothetical protein LTR03_010029 [Friedmanniomyces endolithicus]